MIEIKKGSMEERILKILMDRYPVKFSELRNELGVKESIIRDSLNKLCQKKIIELEILPGETFIRLVRTDLSFRGTNPVQKRKVIEKRTKSKKVDDYEGMMYR
jgi:predicted ArsR family transcriptional regulator